MVLLCETRMEAVASLQPLSVWLHKWTKASFYCFYLVLGEKGVLEFLKSFRLHNRSIFRIKVHGNGWKLRRGKFGLVSLLRDGFLRACVSIVRLRYGKITRFL